MSITKVVRQKVVMEAQGYIFSDCPKFGHQLDGEHASNGDHSWKSYNPRDLNQIKANYHPRVTVCQDTLYAGFRVDNAE